MDSLVQTVLSTRTQDMGYALGTWHKENAPAVKALCEGKPCRLPLPVISKMLVSFSQQEHPLLVAGILIHLHLFLDGDSPKHVTAYLQAGVFATLWNVRGGNFALHILI